MNFFKIELMKSFIPVRNKSLGRDYFTDALILERRKINFKVRHLVNTGFPIIFEEIESIKFLF